MPGRLKIIMICLLWLGIVDTNTVHAQLLQDSATVNLVRKGVDCIYNQQFTEAHEIYRQIGKIYPRHPVLYLLQGILTYWENYPMLTTSPVRASFEENMRNCIRASGKKTAYEAEFLLTNLCARGMLLKFYDENNLTMDIIPLTSSTYKYLRHSFDLVDVCTDLQYYTGAYNYYREEYPKLYPVYRPLALLLPSGNREIGLRQLQNAANNAIILRAEAYFLLSWIYLTYESKYPMAMHYSKTLYELYPENPVCVVTYIKNLLLMKSYDEAEKQINASRKVPTNKYYEAQLSIFKGILLEKKYHDMNQAQQYYTQGISRISFFGACGNEYTAYGYFGLSRLCYLKGEKNAGKKFWGKALRLAVSRKINFDN